MAHVSLFSKDDHTFLPTPRNLSGLLTSVYPFVLRPPLKTVHVITGYLGMMLHVAI
ncbi:hypothetical protein M404DRAFT_1000004 [Pisolithus tinctorius Marx 270]|uniref:Uncharacterized protein n=1 Tax=Pisolithus tinctorius Marx 270 TaxID=870435 RepID=A0A0C3K742_PISTI|nr:hypothetical protein M404DRAFT_1000004 [Pisolithus tinctorius Marx 270]